jgi:hypothetical protein
MKETTQVIKLISSMIMLSWVCVLDTGAYFFDKEELEGNRLSTGWWGNITVNVTEPEKNEEFELGKSIDIKWNCELPDPDADFKSEIYLSLRGDKDYFEIKTLNNTCGTYTWDIPDDDKFKSSDLTIKIVVTDEHGLTGEDKSEKFKIKDKEKVLGASDSPANKNKANATPTPTPVASEATPSQTPTTAPSPSPSPSPSPTPSPTPTPEPTATSTPSPAPTPNPGPSPEPEPTPEPTPEPNETPTPQLEPEGGLD